MSVTPTISLQCQLLSACGCSYNIDNSTGTYQPPAGDPFGPAIGWTAGVPQVIIGGLASENAALVGTVNLNLESGASESIVIAFQGTLPPALNIPSIVDWLTDFIAAPTSSGNVPGLLHSGILQDTLDILSDINTAVSSLQNPSNPIPVFITGHSKGGGMASIAAALTVFSASPAFAPAAVYTFASPMIGNPDFVNGFPAEVSVLRFENYLDIVPFTAPSSDFMQMLRAANQGIFETPYIDAIIGVADLLGDGNGEFGYVPLGELNYIDNGGITNPSTNPCAPDIIAALAQNKPGVREVAAAHSHLCGAGYMNGTCNGSGVCPVGYL